MAFIYRCADELTTTVEQEIGFDGPSKAEPHARTDVRQPTVRKRVGEVEGFRCGIELVGVPSAYGNSIQPLSGRQQRARRFLRVKRCDDSRLPLLRRGRA